MSRAKGVNFFWKSLSSDLIQELPNFMFQKDSEHLVTHLPILYISTPHLSFVCAWMSLLYAEK